MSAWGYDIDGSCRSAFWTLSGEPRLGRYHGPPSWQRELVDGIESYRTDHCEIPGLCSAGGLGRSPCRLVVPIVDANIPFCKGTDQVDLCLAGHYAISECVAQEGGIWKGEMWVWDSLCTVDVLLTQIQRCKQSRWVGRTLFLYHFQESHALIMQAHASCCRLIFNYIQSVAGQLPHTPAMSSHISEVNYFQPWILH